MAKIAAIVIVSQSELVTADPKYTEFWVSTNPTKVKLLLYSVGLDTELNYEQEVITHRNRFGNQVTCTRWVGNERQDSEWLKSEYSSRAARDRALNSKLLNDMYRLRGLAE